MKYTCQCWLLHKEFGLQNLVSVTQYKGTSRAFYNSLYANLAKNCKVLHVCKISEIILITEKKHFLFEHCHTINIYTSFVIVQFYRLFLYWHQTFAERGLKLKHRILPSSNKMYKNSFIICHFTQFLENTSDFVYS